MKKQLLYLSLLFFIQMGFAQNNFLWQGYFSYNEIKDISQSPTTVFAAAENALFSKNTTTNVLKTTNTIDGLSGQTITSLYYSPTVNKTIVGYENGLMIVINEADGSMLNIVDIINKQLPSNIKRVNHFMEYKGIIYVSCDFGIVQFNLATMLFGDTYFIGNNGAEIRVTQTAVYNGFIYAATVDGIRRADSTNKNLIDFNQWSQVIPGSWSSIETFDTALFAINTSGYIHKYNEASNSFAGYLSLPQAALDMRATSNYLIVTTPSSVYVYNKQMALVRQINNSQIPETNISFSCATEISETLYIGTLENGIYSTLISNGLTFENSKPDGPLKNYIFNLKKSPNALWAVYGGYSKQYNPYTYCCGGPSQYGISRFTKEKGWSVIPFSKLLNTKAITRIAVNPSNENQIVASSFFSGLLKIKDNVSEIQYNSTNSAIEESFPGVILINGPNYDKDNNLWMTSSRIDNPLKVLKADGTWQTYNFQNKTTAPTSDSYATLQIDKNKTKWIPSYRNGVIAFNENYNNKVLVVKYETNTPALTDVRAVAIDKRNQLWIGTATGLRVLSSVDEFVNSDELIAKSIIILEDGLAQELLYEQFILDIVVDGANNKWISTADSGVFLVSPNGQETKYHFTTQNSPLPSNNVVDVEIDDLTGEVFFATDKGMISFKGTATTANENLENAYIYPNPVRPEYTGTVKITGLLDKATVKITDIEGNLVYETTSEGGTIEWDTTAFGKYKVATGVYMVFISAQDGIETKVKKVMIIR